MYYLRQISTKIIKKPRDRARRGENLPAGPIKSLRAQFFRVQFSRAIRAWAAFARAKPTSKEEYGGKQIVLHTSNGLERDDSNGQRGPVCIRISSVTSALDEDAPTPRGDHWDLRRCCNYDSYLNYLNGY
jgi:hypothetical protein